MSAAIVLLVACCVVLSIAVWRSERRRRRASDGTQRELERLLCELRGRYDELLSDKQRQLQDVARDRDAYKELATAWSERIASIESSLVRIDRQAINTIGEMVGSLRPIVSIFRSPQVAGIEFGEAELEMLLRTHLGESLYTRKPRLLAAGQEAVDFVITLPDCVVPIDSKFPSASYRAWVESRSEEEGKAAWRKFRNELLEQLAATAKYIRPEAGTTDYALLFVPSDVIYQQAFLTQRVHDQENPIPERSRALHVFGCSPQTLLPYFGLIRLGLRNFKIAEDVKGIRHQIEELDVSFRTFAADWRTLRDHVAKLARHVEGLAANRGSVTRLGVSVEKLSSPHRHDRLGPGSPAGESPAESQGLLELAQETP